MAFIAIYDADALYPNTVRDLLIRIIKYRTWFKRGGLKFADVRDEMTLLMTLPIEFP